MEKFSTLSIQVKEFTKVITFKPQGVFLHFFKQQIYILIMLKGITRKVQHKWLKFNFLTDTIQ